MIGPIIFMLGGLVLGIGSILVWMEARKNWRASLEWPTAPGRIVSTTIEQLPNAGEKSWDVKVFYTFINAYGQEVSGTRIDLSGRFFRKPEAENIADRYLPGSEVTVRYDPTGSGLSCLEIAKADNSWLVYGACGLLVALIAGLGVTGVLD